MGRRRGTGAGSGTFGFSSGKAKLWEPQATNSLAEFRRWCTDHAAVLAADPRAAAPGSRIALLNLPDRLDAFPESSSVSVLPPELLSDARALRLGGEAVEPLELLATSRTRSDGSLELRLEGRSQVSRLSMNVDGSIQIADGSARLIDRVTGETTELDAFLEEYPPTILFGDGSVVRGPQITRQPTAMGPLPPEARSPQDWSGVDLSFEFPRPATIPLTATNSVAGATLELLKGNADWVIQDHLPGEMADFIAIRQVTGLAKVDLVHCKKPGGAAATRVTDIEELLAQSMRSVYLATSGPTFWSLLLDRIRTRNATKIVQGEPDAVTNAVEAWANSPPLIEWSITAVQPGVADHQLQTWSEGNALMLAAYMSCRGQGVAFRLIDAA